MSNRLCECCYGIVTEKTYRYCVEREMPVRCLRCAYGEKSCCEQNAKEKGWEIKEGMMPIREDKCYCCGSYVNQRVVEYCREHGKEITCYDCQRGLLPCCKKQIKKFSD